MKKPLRFCRKRVVVWASLLVAVAAGAFWGYRSFNPPCRVRVHLATIPVGTDFACLVADDGGAMRTMDWSPSSELSIPFTMHPADCGWSYQNPDRPKVDWHAYVRWQPGEQYGVVTKGTDGTWRVTWFQAEAVSIPRLRWFFGCGEATFDLALGRTVPLPAEQVQTLGLAKVVGQR
jgi:hypothetical protein